MLMQYDDFPDAPAPALDLAAATKEASNATSSPSPAPATKPKRTTLFGSVLDRLVVSSVGTAPAGGAVYTGMPLKSPAFSCRAGPAACCTALWCL